MDEIEFCLKRTQRVYFDGAVGVKTHLDETRQVVWVNLNDLMEDIGLPIESEIEWFESEGGSVFATNIGLHVQKMFNDKGEEYYNMFIPHMAINDYLYNRPVENLPPDIVGNLLAYRRGFAVELDKFWRGYSKTVDSADAFDLRRLLWLRGHDKLKMAARSIEDAGVTTAVRIAERIRWFSFNLLNKKVGPMSSLTDGEMDLYRLIESCYVDNILIRVKRGEDPREILPHVEKTLDMYLGHAWRVLKI